jgi:hypothetical protein
MKPTLIIFAFLAIQITFSQSISGKELLDKAIQYHDPNGNWERFNSALNVAMETPNSPQRLSNIHINLPEEYFYIKAKRDTTTTEYTLNKDVCIIALNGETKISAENLKANNLSCDRANMYKNYYTYLYGLPMKLKDPGTNISETVQQKRFKGKEYLVLEAKYDEAVGSDVWYFYFDPTTYAMEIYQFFKGDPNGKGKDTGEYILLTEEVTIQNIKMPKNRAWYYNKDDKYLGTDTLKTN